ncbi:hypothetical protein [Pseudorhizobium marinum]|jgi:hypothetical protein|uniref:hypothetical protein n=1 Tax=Pseudorhizobium marinum TaxID=1496690 RepID=UPI000495A492|nr:hypothetical protein [Pseudorhizobium marinum]
MASEYELLRTQHHELLHRSVATKVGAPFILCGIRKCRRDKACTGPMQPSRHTRGAVQAQQLLGMSGNACARLPTCIAAQEDDNYAVYQTHARQELEAARLRKTSEKQLRQLASRPWPSAAATSLLTSSPCHPTSNAKKKG